VRGNPTWTRAGKMLVKSHVIEMRGLLEGLLDFANTWARDREYVEATAPDKIHISEWGLGYKQACRDFYDRISNAGSPVLTLPDPLTTEPRRFRYSYRLHIKEEGDRNAVELSVPLREGEPCSLKEVEQAMKEAVERAVEEVL